MRTTGNPYGISRVQLLLWLACTMVVAVMIFLALRVANFQREYPLQLQFDYPGDLALLPKPPGEAANPTDEGAPPSLIVSDDYLMASTAMEQLQAFDAIARCQPETIARAYLDNQPLLVLGTSLEQELRTYSFIAPPEPNSRYLSGHTPIDPAFVTADFAIQHKLRKGSRFTLDIEGKARLLVVTAVIRNDAKAFAIAVDRSALTIWLAKDNFDNLLIKLKPGSDIPSLRAKLAEAFPQADVVDMRNNREHLAASSNELATFGYAAITLIGMAAIAGLITFARIGKGAPAPLKMPEVQ